MYAGERGRGVSIAMMVVLGTAGLLFTGLAVFSDVSHGRAWALTAVSPVITGIIVWLILRRKMHRTDDSATATRPLAHRRAMVILGLAGLALMGLAVFLVSS